jgi:SAM-dependent methyltransferase
MRLSSVIRRWKLQLRRRLRGPSERRVLDVGSGHRPHDDATHLVDLLPEDDSERGKPIQQVGLPLLLATVESLPFKDKTFDYVYASHVLEHTRDPASACKELMRIARAGYIETPSPFYEQGYNYPARERGWSFHRWFVYLGEGDTLTFEPKTDHTIDDFCDCRHGQFIKRIYQSMKDLNQLHGVLPRDCSYTVLHWKDEFKFAVKDNAEHHRC